MADRARDRKQDAQARDDAADVDALNAAAQSEHEKEVAAQAAIEAQVSLDAATAVAEEDNPAAAPEASQDDLDAAAQDPLNEEVQVAVVEAFRTEDGSPIEVSIAGLSEKFPADGSVITLTERQARLYEESPAIERVQVDEEDDA